MGIVRIPYAAALLTALALSACASATDSPTAAAGGDASMAREEAPTGDMQQVRDACSVVGRWPEWIYSVWPKTVERAAAKGTDGGEEMAQFVRLTSGVFEFTDPQAVQIIEDYANYWVMLNADLAATGGVPPSKDAVSTQALTRLFEGCEKMLGTKRF